MQDKTINNALLALRKTTIDADPAQADLVGRLIELRGIPLPDRSYQNEPMRRGECKRLMLAKLSEGPATQAELADAVQALRPDITRRRANHRAYMAMQRLADAGKVVRGDGPPDEGLWRLSLATTEKSSDSDI